MLYVTPLVVLAVQLRSISLLDAAVAPKFVGGFGGGGGASVVALAWFEDADDTPERTACVK
jgi:hypothetical protein